MNAPVTSSSKLVKKLKAGSFSFDKLPSYSLCLQVGVRDFQFAVINKQTNSCLVLEDYKLENIKTINSRLEAIRELYDRHPILTATQWDSIKLSFKTHKFTLVPSAHFLPEVSSDYLALNSEIKTKIEDVYYYKHISSSAVNIFAADKRVIQWARGIYPGKNIQILHQGSAFIEGIITYNDHSHEQTLFTYFDRGILHIAVTLKQKLLFYNQFAARTNEDFLKYILLVFKELQLSPKKNNLVVWGFLKNDAPQIEFLKKYIRNISYGEKPSYLKPTRGFEELENHRYFDLYSIFLCE